MESRAIDLLTGEVTPDTRTDEQRTLLDRLHLYGNNGWGDSFSKTVTPRILAELRDHGLCSRVTLGAMLARGASSRGIKRLQHYLDRL